jgi:hypothetical protein
MMVTYTETDQAAAAATVAAYRSRHAIDPEYPRDTRQPENWCRVCGIRIRPIKGGWRHDLGEIERLAGIAPVGFARGR